MLVFLLFYRPLPRIITIKVEMLYDYFGIIEMSNNYMAGAERLELPTPGFGDRCSTN